MSMTDTRSSPYVRLRSLSWNDSRWTGGFWGQYMQLCYQKMVPLMKRHMCETERVKFAGNFEVAAGLIEGRHRGPRWNDGDFYKYLEGATAIAGIYEDRSLVQEVESLARLIATAQREDGYIHTDIQIRQKSGEKVTEFDNPLDFEMYNMGHLMTLAVVHRRTSGSNSLLKIAIKTAEFLDRTFAHPQPHQARHGICPSHLMGLIELYRETGNSQYRDLACRLLEMRNLVETGDDDNQDRIPFREHTTAHGHAVRATYLYAGMADIYSETGDESLLRPLLAVWQDLVSHKLYLTGGCGALFDGASPDGSADQSNITRVHQAFGRSYQLPQSTAHNETCAAIGNLLWNWRMLQITADSRYADMIELTLYNSVLTGVSLDGSSYTYTNTLRKLDPMPVSLRWSTDRQKTISCFCCPPNVVRTIAESSHYAYLRSEQAVYVILYGTNQAHFRFHNNPVTIRQESDYPWDGQIRLRIDLPCPVRFSVVLRIPGWCNQAFVSINGRREPVECQSGTFVALDREWTSGDQIELSLSMPPILMEAHPYVEEARHQAAVRRGPIVYCLESCDLPDNTRINDVLLNARESLTVGAPDASLLGARPVESIGWVRESVPWDDNRLYRTLSPRELNPVRLRFVPYFVWGNRRPGEMSVWIPVLF